MHQKSLFLSGVVSIFLIVIIICLNVFSVLSLATANADYKFALSSTQTIHEYYGAEERMQYTLIQVDNLLRLGASAEEIAKQVGANVTDEGNLLLKEQVAEFRQLEVSLALDDSGYNIQSFVLKRIPQPIVQNQKVWNGD